MREASLDDPALAAQAGAVRCPAASDYGRDAECPQQPTVLVVVIATVGQDTIGLLAWPAALAGHWPGVEVFQQRDELCDVVAVPASQRDRQRDAAGVDEEMVL